MITNDKDFGEKIFRDKRSHRGVVLLRLTDERAKGKIAVLDRVLGRFGEDLVDHFVVATETRIRISAK